MSDPTGETAFDRRPEGREDVILTIRVTEQDIAEGKPEQCMTCPIALAVRRACLAIGWLVAEPHGVKVYGDYLYVNLECGTGYTAEMPYEAREFVHHFDRGPFRAVYPFRFRLRLYWDFELTQGVA